MPHRAVTRIRKRWTFSSLLVTTVLIFAMIGLLIAFPKAKDLMTTVASGALALVAVMTLPRRPST
jgi:hypothetical protein